jgi:glyoxylase-like metal-dependent hydrolase (beta-lactamase superfamily II)
VDLGFPVCGTCGVQFPEGVDRERCPICADERQYLGWSGQRWTSLGELAAEGRHGEVIEEAPGLFGVGVDPSVAIGQRALLVPGPGGNVLWDCVQYVDDELFAAVADRGGLSAIAISHPHFYGAMHEWSRAFGDVPIYVHEADRTWVPRPDNVELWSGETQEILPGRTLVNAGVHFAGGTVLHWADGAEGQGALCTGDIFHVVMDRRWLSFMYSYPNLIPERPAVVRRALALMQPFAFDAIYGGWWQRVVATDAKAALDRSVERYLRFTGQ